ncbi:Uncharacterised protein [Enterobacter roggenkampii]|nr:Uncharacterised protein [Enterobacter roggenkampii]
MVILNKLHLSSYSFFEDLLIKTFKEITTLIAKNFWLKNKNIRNACINNFHRLSLQLFINYFHDYTLNTVFPIRNFHIEYFFEFFI